MVSIKKWRRKTINCLRAGAREYDFKRILETMNTPCTILQHSCFDDAHYCTAIKQLPWFTKNVCNNEKSLPRLQYHLLIKACARMGAMQFPLITLYVHCSVFNTNDMSGMAFIDFTWNHIQFTSHFFLSLLQSRSAHAIDWNALEKGPNIFRNVFFLQFNRHWLVKQCVA